MLYKNVLYSFRLVTMYDHSCHTYACVCVHIFKLMGVVWRLQVIDNQVVMVRTKERDGHFALQIGAIDHPKLKNVSHSNVYSTDASTN